MLLTTNWTVEEMKKTVRMNGMVGMSRTAETNRMVGKNRTTRASRIVVSKQIIYCITNCCTVCLAYYKPPCLHYTPERNTSVLILTLY